MQSLVVPTNSHEVKRELKQFRDHVTSCYGPHGRIAILQPIAEGHVTVTCQSSQMYQLYKSSNPLLQVLYLSLQSHTQHYHDGGKFGALLITNLVLNALQLELPMRKVSDIVTYLLRDLSEYLQSDICSCIWNVDWSSVKQLMNIVKTLLTSRQAVSQMDTENINHTASVLIQGFLHTISTSSRSTLPLSQHVHIHTILGCNDMATSFYKGLLIELQHTKSIDSETTLPFDFKLTLNSQGVLPAVIYNVSLNGDQPDGFTEHMNLELDTLQIKEPTLEPFQNEKPILKTVENRERSSKQSDTTFKTVGSLKKEGNLQILMRLGSVLVDKGVKVVICQKCVHPELRRFLEAKGILVIERLGSLLIGPICDITGGCVIGSLMPSLESKWIGHLNNIHRLTIAERKYLLLEGEVPHVSLVMHCISEVIADEMKPLFNTIIQGMEELLKSPKVLCGGGCTETLLAYYISQWSDKVTKDILNDLNSDMRTFTSVVEMVHLSLLQTASAFSYNTNSIVLMDAFSYHCWMLPQEVFSDEQFPNDTDRSCMCGSVKLSNLPIGTSWKLIKGQSIVETIIPDNIHDFLTASQFKTQSGSDGVVSTFLSPTLCDVLIPKVAAYQMVGDIASLMIRTGVCVC